MHVQQYMTKTWISLIYTSILIFTYKDNLTLVSFDFFIARARRSPPIKSILNVGSSKSYISQAIPSAASMSHSSLCQSLDSQASEHT